ncbi:MAG: choice-of-anchor I family protein [Cyanobacteria bacterium P01_E01_bin.6]
MSIELTPIGTFATGIFDEGAAEINAYDPDSQRLFVVNSDATTLDVLDLSDPTNPTLIGSIDATSFGAGANSVAVKNGVVAVAIESDPSTDPGQVVFFDADVNIASFDSASATSVTVGSLPDAVTFTADGSKLLVANEAEPDDGIDPEGSISIIDTTTFTVQTASFTAFNGQEDALRAAGVRIFPGASVANDLEPEFIAVSPDGSTAFVTLQENNAVAVVDIATATVTAIQPLGVKDHSADGNGFDASDDDGVINIQPQPVFGLFMPDAIASFEANGQVYYVTANEGDARDEDDRVANLTLDPTAFPNAADLQQDENLGRLEVSTIDGDTDGDGDFDQLFAYGARSFSIFDSSGTLVFDSGDDFEQITAAAFPDDFNANNDENGSFDSRSDAKGPEPEGVVVGEVGGETYAFIGLERVGGIATYNVSDPENAEFVQYINTRDFSGDAEAGTAGDLGPEGLTFISASDSPNGEALLAVSNEVSGTTTIYQVEDTNVMESTFTLELLHAADQEAGIPALDDVPRFSAVLNALKAEDLGNDGVEDNTIVLSSGDAVIPGVFFNASIEAFGAAGRGDILIQNELGFQAIAFGNHEFDQGTGVVADFIGAVEDDPTTPEDESYAGTQFPYLSSNLDVSTDENLAGLVVDDAQASTTNSIAASTVLTVNGEKIGVVGATTPTISNVNVSISSPGDVTVLPQPFDGVPTSGQLDALAAEIQADVDALLESDPDINKVVLLAHMQQLDIERELAKRLENVDIIVAGGSNTRLFDDNDIPRAGDSNQGPYPIVETGADGNPVAVVNTDGNYKYVGRLVIDFDENGVIIPESYDSEVSGAYATDDAGVAALNAESLVDPEIQAIVDELRDIISATESNVFGVSTVYLNGVRGSVRTEETNLGNLTADANLAIAKESDDSVLLSIKNGGGIRDDIGQVIVPAGGTGDPLLLPNEEIPGVKPEGGISQTDIENTLRFNNGLTLLTVTAEELLAIAEHAVAASSLDDSNTQGRFPQIAGFSFSFDLTLPAGDRIQSLAIEDENGNDIDVVVENGEIVGDANRTFRLVTLGFLADGGDGYPFPTGDAANRLDLNQDDLAPRTGDATFAPDGSEQDALAEYLFDNFLTTPFTAEDTSRELDERIQNLTFRDDTVLDDGIVTPPTGNKLGFEGFAAGTVVTDQFEGATFSTLSSFGVMIFDTANITGGDEDLASDTLGNVLIISEDGDSSDADDALQGGTITVEFDELTNVDSITLLDIEETGGKVTLFDIDGILLETVDIQALEDNSVQTIALNTGSVSSMEIMLAGSGAVAELSLGSVEALS